MDASDENNLEFIEEEKNNYGSIARKKLDETSSNGGN